MPAYNVEPFVAEAIGSIARQSFDDFELIVVDDQSSDGTSQRLAEAQDAWPHSADRLVLLRQASGGAAAARNAGVAVARGELLGFIDADDRWSPDTLASLVAALDAFPDSDIACPRYRRIDEHGAPVNYLGETVSGSVATGGAFEHFDAGAALVSTPAESATGVLVRRAAFEAGGGFDAGLKSNNDIDCWLRILWARGSTLVQCPDAIVDYRIRAAQITSNVQRMREGHERFLRNHQPLLRAIGARARRRHFGHVRAYWALLSARNGEIGAALRYWWSAVWYAPRLALPGTLGSSAAFAIAKATLPVPLWRHLSAARRRLRRQ